MLVATFEADRVVGLGGALAPEEVREVQYAVRTAHPRLWYAYGIYVRVAPRGQALPCASATYSTHVAGNAFSRHIQYRGPGTYVSA